LKVTSAGKAKFDLVRCCHNPLSLTDTYHIYQNFILYYHLLQNMAKAPAWLPPSTDAPLDVSVIIGSFKYQPINQPLFQITLPPSAPAPTTPDAVHYSAQPEIQHTFRPDAKIPMKAISALFTLATLSPWVVLLGLVSDTPPSFKIQADLFCGYSGYKFLTARQNCSPTKSSHSSLY